jgi:hypothetical protein
VVLTDATEIVPPVAVSEANPLPAPPKVIAPVPAFSVSALLPPVMAPVIDKAPLPLEVLIVRPPEPPKVILPVNVTPLAVKSWLRVIPPVPATEITPSAALIVPSVNAALADR